ncbi:molybdate ABC transporter substrate-binding protein [Wohlfahrtiimonas chitiniclastica]|uniref:molybdate ABC transporter substrate-binding protein n=1 Tax=Wohlfahrtiimonas chitiniclastica TaxID=400946 RepID=UPI000B98E9DD|nr:molybdate ABC transporter substrate-binding protein [Wohlfahrtiimonas chitiniclastica]OYQ90065.1 molybdate ABC transporter substrate-binding protein [Wohlfahrtiimonas chitiniclastica]
MKKHLIATTLIASFFTLASAEEIMVSAAASLTNAFTDIAKNYEKAHPEDKVMLNFAGSGALLQQMENGAPVDIFASADQVTMDKAIEKKLVKADTRKTFVQNTLVVIVSTDSKLDPKNLEDLTKTDVTKIALANPASVPVGRYTKSVLEAAKLWQTLEPKFIETESVRQSLAYVAQNETDTGFVYGTDAAVLKKEVRVAFTVPTEQPITYPIALTTDSKKGSDRFYDYIFNADSQKILEDYGFTKPE